MNDHLLEKGNLHGGVMISFGLVSSHHDYATDETTTITHLAKLPQTVLLPPYQSHCTTTPTRSPSPDKSELVRQHFAVMNSQTDKIRSDTPFSNPCCVSKRKSSPCGSCGPDILFQIPVLPAQSRVKLTKQLAGVNSMSRLESFQERKATLLAVQLTVVLRHCKPHQRKGIASTVTGKHSCCEYPRENDFLARKSQNKKP
jgi:hypothetical protein